MAQIRKVTPSARLIQTEDLGHTYATPPVAAQAESDNARRWMTWDLLCGRRWPGLLLAKLERLGFAKRLRALAAHPSAQIFSALNHYLTSDRFLDHRSITIRPTCGAGTEQSAFADVEAIRVTNPSPADLKVRSKTPGRGIAVPWPLPRAIMDVRVKAGPLAA